MVSDIYCLLGQKFKVAMVNAEKGKWCKSSAPDFLVKYKSYFVLATLRKTNISVLTEVVPSFYFLLLIFI